MSRRGFAGTRPPLAAAPAQQPSPHPGLLPGRQRLGRSAGRSSAAPVAPHRSAAAEGIKSYDPQRLMALHVCSWRCRPQTGTHLSAQAMIQQHAERRHRTSQAMREESSYFQKHGLHCCGSLPKKHNEAGAIWPTWTISTQVGASIWSPAAVTSCTSAATPTEARF